MRNPVLPVLACMLTPLLGLAQPAPELPKVREILERYRKANDLVHKHTAVRQQNSDVRPILLCEDIRRQMPKAPDYGDAKSVTKFVASKTLDPKMLQKLLKIPNIFERPTEAKIYTGPIKREGPMANAMPMNADSYNFLRDVHHLNETRRKDLEKWDREILTPVLERPLGVSKDGYLCRPDLEKMRKDIEIRIRLLERLSGRLAAAKSKHGRGYFSHQVWMIENVELRNYVVKFLQKDGRRWYFEGPNCDPLAAQIKAITDGYADQHAAATEMVEYLNSQADSLRQLEAQLGDRVKDCGSL